MLKTVKLRKTASVLTIIGGTTSAVSCGLFCVVTGFSWGLIGPPSFPLPGFILGMLVILGGMFIIRGRVFLGGNLAIWSGIANWFFGFSATAQAIGFLIRGLAGVTAGFTIIIFGITLVIVFPVLGGVLSLMSGRSQKNETSQ